MNPGAVKRTGLRVCLSMIFALSSLIAIAQPDTSEERAETSAIERETSAGKDPLAAQSDAIEREASAGEDPLTTQTSENEEDSLYKYRDHTSFKLYSSARMRYTILDSTSSEDSDPLDDGGTRAGINGELQFRPRFWLLGRAEIGFNIFDSLDLLKNAFGKEIQSDAKASIRLLYGGIQTPSSTAVFGKNWSTYYQVADITDRFESFGGDASGAFNAQTDGGPTGTGRADNVLQGRFSIDTLPKAWRMKPFKLNVQLQAGEDIPYVPGARYSGTFGFSALLETRKEKQIGIAYNHAFMNPDDLDALRKQGISGDAQAFIIGTRRFADRYYLGSTLSFLEDQETTDEGIYFDGWGWEVFGSYNIRKKWWLVGGWNSLQPYRKESQAKNYRIRYGVVGLRYSFDHFRRMLYTEFRIDNSRNADGIAPGNIYTAGARWDF